jgi:two-component system response regulator RegA
MSDHSSRLAAKQPQKPIRRLLIVDRDDAISSQIALAMRARGFAVRIATDRADCSQAIALEPFDCALVDVRLGSESGLEMIGTLHAAQPNARIVVFSGYGNLATVVAAIKAGAADYLLKPSSPDAIEAALISRQEPLPPPIAAPLRAEWVCWEHIRSVFAQSGHNVSETARKLRMHRRTLQRILARGEPREPRAERPIGTATVQG